MIHAFTMPITPAAPAAQRPGAATSKLSVGTLVGSATKYNTPTGDRGGYVIRLSAGCFAKSLKSNAADIRALAYHNDNCILARLSAGTMRLSDGPIGLLVSIDLPDTSLGRDLWTLANRGDIDQMSVSFNGIDESWLVESLDGSKTKTSILQVDEAGLTEVSLVCWPAITSATFRPQLAPEMKAAPAAALSRAATPRNDRQRLEDFLKNRGTALPRSTMSITEARRVVAQREARVKSHR